MTAAQEPSPGTRALGSLEHDVDRLRIRPGTDVAPALAELRAQTDLRDRVVLLGEWALHYPRATSQLMAAIEQNVSATEMTKHTEYDATMAARTQS